MLNDSDKTKIVCLIEAEVLRMGSQSKLAVRCDVSDATISNIRGGKWNNIRNEMWLKISTKLGGSSVEGWVIASNTTNFKMIHKTLSDAQMASMFMAISHKAGSGKTATIMSFRDQDTTGNVFVLQSEEWARREFLVNLCRSLGIPEGKGYETVNVMSDKVIRFFAERTSYKPILIIDEADKLKPSALRWLINFYNKLEDRAGCVICGTDNLEKEIRRGVKYNTKGYDELDSRFGRSFIKLIGATINDVKAICCANGITDEVEQRNIFESAGPIRISFRGKDLVVVEDMRRIKRLIMSANLRNAS
jgi:plasmid maintenance system antidote protein VapI